MNIKCKKELEEFRNMVNHWTKIPEELLALVKGSLYRDEEGNLCTDQEKGNVGELSSVSISEYLETETSGYWEYILNQDQEVLGLRLWYSTQSPEIVLDSKKPCLLMLMDEKPVARACIPFKIADALNKWAAEELGLKCH